MSESTTTTPEPETGAGALLPAGPAEEPGTAAPGEARPAGSEAAGTAPPDGPAPASAEAAPGPAPAPRRGHVLRTAGRWTAAVAVFGLVGTGIALGLIQPERSELPGLATAADGRWDYPELTLPALPSGAPRPFAPGNRSEAHHANIRDLLLPPPEHAKAAADLPNLEGQWVTIEEFTKVFRKKDRKDLKQALVDDGVRHVAARGWTMPDGTRTGVYLLQFNSQAFTRDFYRRHVSAGLAPYVAPLGTNKPVYDDDWPSEAGVPNLTLYPFDERKPRGKEHVRSAYLIAGDTLGVVVQSREGTARTVPFQQTVILQSQLLG